MSDGRSVEEGRGHHAERPSEIPLAGWRDIARRVLQQTKEDHISLVAAGVAFYSFLALFPALITLVSIYGLFTDPAELEAHLSALAGFVPAQVLDLLRGQLRDLTMQPEQALGWSAVASVVVSIWSANKGTKALFKGLNIAYDETDTRGFLKENSITLVFTVSIFFAAVVALFAIVGISALLDQFSLPIYAAALFSFARWPVLGAGLLGILAILYKKAPVRTNPTLRWVSLGSVIAAVLWIFGSWAFSLYVENFGSYGETYGALAAIVIFLFWLYLSAFVVLLGAEINAEMEHQTAHDTTVGPGKPMGERGAYHADHVAS